MRIVESSSVEDYASWYLRRESRKGDTRPIPKEPEQQVQAMMQRHEGKMRKWFSATTRWHIVSLDDVNELANLVFLECEWTKEEGLVVPAGKNYRILSRVAENAKAGDYLDRPSARKHKAYYNQLLAGSLLLQDENRIAICSAEPSEIASNPAARYYLLDGVGRCLPYMILLKERKIEHTSIEAFLAEMVLV
jgi:hypothetical protein